MLIAEELLLICLDNDTGRRTLGTDRLDPALAGALLAELALMERIGVTADDEGWLKRGRITITNLKPTDDVELDRALQVLTQREGKKVKDLVSGLSLKPLSKGLRLRLLGRLAAAGVLTEHHGKVLGLFPHRTWPLLDPAPEEEVRRRLQSALVVGLTPTERTVSLIGLLHATRHVAKAVPSDEPKMVKARAKALAEGDWVAKAVKQAIDDAAAAGAAAAT